MEKKIEFDEKLHMMRHSLAHVLAKAIVSLYPETKLTIGPAIEDGCYYDIDLNEPITPEKYTAIEERARSLSAK